MKWLKRILVAVVVLVLLVLAGATTYALTQGRAPAKRPDLVTALPPNVPPPPAGYPSESLSYAAAFLLHDLIPWSGAPSVPGVVEKRDIVFGTGGEKPLRLDLYTPENITGAQPGLLLLYGGGWRQGDKEQLRTYAQYLAKRGYVVATSEYRLREEGRWPASVHDAKCAIRWMRAHAAEHNIDPNRIGVMGNSAGGYLALMVAYTANEPEFEGNGGWQEHSSAVQAVVDCYAPTDFTEPIRRDHPLVVAYLNGHYEENKERFEKASPIRYVHAGSPPTCVIHGTVDMLVPVHQSDWLVEKLRENNVPHLYSRIDGWPHPLDFVREVRDHTEALVAHFFDRHLGGATALAANTTP